ncbi:Gfo/Idh/MocA family protein [Aureimonas fodinaquatilis]|nr:Gfo/Idh/MocA family oxidoreductase [Aureimonas fodinaquatilis]
MLKAAIVGLGWWGRTIITRMAHSDRMQIVTAVDVDPAKHEDYARENGLELHSDYERVLADPNIDCVILCTPNSLHTTQVEAAAKAGKHVFCEKPLALTRAEAQRSVDACRKAGVLLGIGHERRFERAMQEVRRLVRSGELGTIMHAESNFSHDKLINVPQNDWRRSSKESPAAGMTAMGIHLSDAYVNLFGPAQEVYALTANRVLNSENGDVVSVLLRFENGVTAYLNAVLYTPLYLRFTVFGTKAWVEFRNDTHPDTPGPSTLTVQVTGEEPKITQYDWTDSVRENLDSFADAVKGQGDYIFTDIEKVGNIAILEAIAVSAASGQPVTIKPA